jgi:RNA polymerase sigma-70 factor (ECF subfamily)
MAAVMPPDDELVAAIERAYRAGYPRFLRLAVALLRDADQGRDAVQEAFVRALRSRGDLRRIDSLDGWLWRTLVNVCLAQRRTRTLAEEAPSFETNGQAEEWPEVRAAIAALPERQRVVLFLRHYADLDYRQIADALRIERGTVAATLHAAHRTMKQLLTEVPG